MQVLGRKKNTNKQKLRDEPAVLDVKNRKHLVLLGI